MGQGVYFGVITGCSGVAIGSLGIGSPGYVAPGIVGGMIGYMIESTKEAVVSGVLAGLAGRFVAGRIAKWVTPDDPNQTMDLDTALTITRGVVFGSALGGALIGLAIPTINQKLLTA